MSKRISAAVKPYMLPEADRNVASRFSHGVDDQLVRDVRAAGPVSPGSRSNSTTRPSTTPPPTR